MTVHFRDEFTDANGVQLSAHAPAPIAGGGVIWEYITAGAAPYEIDTNAVIDAGTGVANPARASQIILDDFIEITALMQRAGPLTLAQTGQLHICMAETAIAAAPGRITLIFANSQIQIQVVDDAGSLVTLNAVSDPRDPNVQFEMGMTKAGDILEGWSQDIGGANRVTVSATLNPTQQALYEDGAHRMVGITCTGTQAGHYRCDVMQAADFEPVLPVGSTLLTSASGVPVLNILQAITPTGSALQTLASEDPLIAIALTPIGSAFGRLVTGLPTFTGTTQEAQPSAPPTADVMTLAAPPQNYNQYDESQTRRQLELAATLENLRMDAIERVLVAQTVTEAALQQTAASDIFIVDLIPTALDMPTDLLTQVPNRWSEPVEGTLRYTSVDYGRLGLVFIFFQLEPASNNRTFIVDLLANEVIVRTLEFQTGTSGLRYPVSISDLFPFQVGTTDIRVQITSTATNTIDISDFQITGADFFSAIGFDLGSPDTTAVAQVVPVSDTSFLRELVRNFATLLPVASPIPIGQNRHAIAGDVSLGALATGYVKQSGSGTLVIPVVNTFIAFDPTTTLDIKSSAWLQPADAELTIIVDDKRVVSIAMAFVLDTNAANQMYEIRMLLNGTPTGGVFPILLQGNQPQGHTLSFIAEIDVGLTTISFEVQNTSSGQDLDVDDYTISITDQLADG